MSKKPSEDQKKANRKLHEQHFSPRNNETHNSDGESLEVRMLGLVYAELLRTTGENEFVSLENRISRILRNEYVNDIMREINTADDEVAAWFNRFLGSFPELRCAYRNGNAVQGVVERSIDGKNHNNVQRKTSNGSKSQKSERNLSSSFVADERTMRHILEMFRAPIQLTCRACEDMRRIIRAGRRMIREIQLLATMQSEAQSMTRVIMKCTEELDQLRTSRRRRTTVTLQGWRQLLRRRVRSIYSSQDRERSWYYLVFGRLGKRKFVPRMASATKQMVLKLKKLIRRKGRIHKPQGTIWTNIAAKAEIANIISSFREFRLKSDCDSPPTHDPSHPPLLVPVATTTTITTTTITTTTAPSENNENENSSSETHQVTRANIPNTPDFMNDNILENGFSGSNQSIGEESLYSCGLESYCSDSSCSQSDGSVYIGDVTLRNAHDEALIVSSIDGPNMSASAFTVTVNTGEVGPQDITVLLYANRILEVSIYLRLSTSETCRRRRRWLLPITVNVDNLQCFLDGNILVITEFSSSSRLLFGQNPESILGPPIRTCVPCPRNL